MILDLASGLALGRRLLAQGAEAETSQLAGIALMLARVHTQVGEAIEPLKGALRARAAVQRPGPEVQTVTLVGEWAGGVQGTVAVTFPTATLRLSPTANIPELQGSLGSEFGRYFEVVTTYRVRKDFLTQVQSQLETQGPPPREVEIALAAVENTESTPRVAFRPASFEPSSGGGFLDLDPEAP